MCDTLALRPHYSYKPDQFINELTFGSISSMLASSSSIMNKHNIQEALDK